VAGSDGLVYFPPSATALPRLARGPSSVADPSSQVGDTSVQSCQLLDSQPAGPAPTLPPKWRRSISSMGRSAVNEVPSPLSHWVGDRGLAPVLFAPAVQTCRSRRFPHATWRCWSSFGSAERYRCPWTLDDGADLLEQGGVGHFLPRRDALAALVVGGL
jgi:hypothetical protein